MIRVLAVGDLVLECDDSWPLLEPAAETLAGGDLVFGHLEIPHVVAGTVDVTDVPALPGPPSALDGLARAGFHAVTLAGNHAYDFGAEGLRSTVAECASRGIATAGSGETLSEALEPTIVERHGLRIALLSVNCVGPRESWATGLKPGVAYVEAVTHYATRGANPGGPPRVFTFIDPPSLSRFAEAVASAADLADIVLVGLHKGLVHSPVEIADYEYEVSHAAIDAGAAAVFGHHAHIFKGVEVYRGRPIFHGLGNFVTVTAALNAGAGDAEERAAWARARQKLFGFVPDPQMPMYPFHPESRDTAVAVLDIHPDGNLAASLIPCRIDASARPVPLRDGPEFDRVCGYLQMITAEAGLRTSFSTHDSRLVVALHERQK